MKKVYTNFFLVAVVLMLSTNLHTAFAQSASDLAGITWKSESEVLDALSSGRPALSDVELTRIIPSDHSTFRANFYKKTYELIVADNQVPDAILGGYNYATVQLGLPPGEEADFQRPEFDLMVELLRR